jgi:transposase
MPGIVHVGYFAHARRKFFEAFKKWLMRRNEEVPPSLLLGKAIRYSLAQWDKMAAYLGSPRLMPDNNACENAIRPFVLGRKNWFFCKSPEGAESSCGMYSLIETAKQNGLVPLRYLTALFEKPRMPPRPMAEKNSSPGIFSNNRFYPIFLYYYCYYYRCVFTI